MADARRRGLPVVGVVFYRAHVLSGNTLFVDDLVAAIERRGAAAIPLVNLSMFISGCCLYDARLIAALLRQHGPGDPCQLVGEGRSQNVRM